MEQIELVRSTFQLELDQYALAENEGIYTPDLIRLKNYAIQLICCAGFVVKTIYEDGKTKYSVEYKRKERWHHEKERNESHCGQQPHS